MSSEGDRRARTRTKSGELADLKFRELVIFSESVVFSKLNPVNLANCLSRQVRFCFWISVPAGGSGTNSSWLFLKFQQSTHVPILMDLHANDQCNRLLLANGLLHSTNVTKGHAAWYQVTEQPQSMTLDYELLNRFIVGTSASWLVCNEGEKLSRFC